MARRKSDMDEPMDESEIADAEVTEVEAHEEEHPPAPMEFEHSAEPMPTHERLRAFEDKVLGAHATRIDGHVEKGIGSPHSRLAAHLKAHHSALLELIEAEKAHMAAGAAETAAHARLDAAIKRASETEPKD